MVETVDAVYGLPEEEARTLARRMWYLGWFGLPLAWAVNAYYFWPHITADDGEDDGDDGDEDVGLGGVGGGAHVECLRKDPEIRRYALMSLRGAQAAAVVVGAWAATFLVGGKQLFGRDAWSALAVTEQPPLE